MHDKRWLVWHVSQPVWHVSHPVWHISNPVWHVSHPVWHVSHPIWHVSHPVWHQACFTSYSMVSTVPQSLEQQHHRVLQHGDAFFAAWWVWCVLCSMVMCFATTWCFATWWCVLCNLVSTATHFLRRQHHRVLQHTFARWAPWWLFARS